MEYHRKFRINIPVTDAVFLGSQQDIEDDFSYDTSKMEAFYAQAGTVLNFTGQHSHYAPCDGKDDGFKVIVVLPRGTNTDLEKTEAVTAERSSAVCQKQMADCAPGIWSDADSCFFWDLKVKTLQYRSYDEIMTNNDASIIKRCINTDCRRNVKMNTNSMPRN